MKIRPYEASDFDAVWKLHNVALEGTGAHLGNGPWDDDLKNIPAVYQQDHGSFLVGLIDDRIIAIGALRRSHSDRAEIKRMRVHPDFQQKGFGTQLLKALETEAFRLGYKVVDLDTAAVQMAAQRLYKKQGYRRTGTTIIGGLDVILFEKELHPLA